MGVPYVIPSLAKNLPEIEMKNNDDSDGFVDNSNVETFVRMILDHVLNRGISIQAQGFRMGLATIMPIQVLSFYTPHELAYEIFGGSSTQLDDHWKMSHLREHITSDVSENSFLNFLSWMESLSVKNRSLFLRFVTGSGSLPPNGFAGLRPKLRLVKQDSGDDSKLPSVMTCTNYLKISEYSSKEIMRAKLEYAILHGQKAFEYS
eukprot:Trichotokara_eunicae@DN2436_c0_g1_i1.p1